MEGKDGRNVEVDGEEGRGKGREGNVVYPTQFPNPKTATDVNSTVVHM